MPGIIEIELTLKSPTPVGIEFTNAASKSIGIEILKQSKSFNIELTQNISNVVLELVNAEKKNIDISFNSGLKGDKGDKGDPGSGGNGGAGSFYRHDQSSAASIWSIPHNLGYRPNVNAEDSAHDQITGQIHHVDDNNLQLIFNSSTGGSAYLS